MKEIIKKYLSHIISISFLVYVNVLIYLIMNVSNYQDKEYIFAILVGLEFIFVIGILAEIIYYFVKVAKNSELKGNPIYYILIYMLNIFYIPCFNLKHIQKDKEYKKKNIVFISIMVILYVMLTFNIMNFTSLETTKVYTSKDNNVTVTISDKYVEKIVGEYDLYYSREDINVGMFLYENEEQSAEDILNYQANYIYRTRDSSKRISNSTKKIKDREIHTVVYKGTMDDIEHVYMMSTITSTNKDNYIVYVVEITRSEAYTENKAEMEKVLENIVINK